MPEAGATVELPTAGRIVHYVLPGGPSKGKHRPGMVVDASEQIADLQVSVAPGDRGNWQPGRAGETLFCRASYSEKPRLGTWHWPERQTE